MKKKEVNEIRKRFKPEHGNLGQVYGCYVNAAREIVSQVDLSLNLMGSDEAEMYLNILKKGISGSLGRNLFDIEFTTEQVENSEEHKLLQALKIGHLKDAGLREAFYQRVIESLDMDGESYVILMVADAYDVPYRSKNEEVFEEGSTEIFDYFVCVVCPVKDSKLALSYQADNHAFRESTMGRVLMPPAIGFMFPAFDDRCTNIYNLLYYSRNINEIHDEFIQNFFKVENTPMSPGDQKATFGLTLSDALGEDCELSVVKAVHEEIKERLAIHKESKEQELPEMYADEVGALLADCGLPEDKVEAFNESCEKQFGKNAALNPSNLVDTSKFEISTTGAKIKVDADQFYSVRTEVIDGRKYILIPVEDAACVNGIDISINGESVNVEDVAEVEF